MPPKAENKVVDTIEGFEPRETRLLAAAFVASTGPDKFNYDLMATLTGNTAGSLKKMFPPVKRKAIEAHPSFAAYLGSSTGAGDGEAKPASAPKAGGKKRKAASEPDDAEATKELNPDAAKAEDETNGNEKANGKKKPAPAKGRGRTKKAKAEKEDANTNDKDEDGEAKVEEAKDEV